MSELIRRKKPQPRICIIGTLPPPLGGTTVLLKQLVDDLQTSGSHPLVVDSRSGGLKVLNPVARIIRVVALALLTVPRADVVTCHINRPAMAIPVIFIARCFRKPVMLRWFGGADYRKFGNSLRHRLVVFGMRHAEMTLMETKTLVQMAIEDGGVDVRWYANSRPLATVTPRERSQCRRFVFVGHVRQAKGIGEIVALDAWLDDRARVDVYGPLMDGFTAESFSGLTNVFYRGEISPESVVQTLCDYDALVLPTYHRGEGYPGVIIEAYMAGIPVITTRWLSIPEIVDEDCGLLIEPRNTVALFEAMMRLVDDPDCYLRLCSGAWARRKQFSSQRWSDVFLSYCVELANRNRKKE